MEILEPKPIKISEIKIPQEETYAGIDTPE